MVVIPAVLENTFSLPALFHEAELLVHPDAALVEGNHRGIDAV